MDYGSCHTVILGESSSITEMPEVKPTTSNLGTSHIVYIYMGYILLSIPLAVLSFCLFVEKNLRSYPNTAVLLPAILSTLHFHNMGFLHNIIELNNNTRSVSDFEESSVCFRRDLVLRVLTHISLLILAMTDCNAFSVSIICCIVDYGLMTAFKPKMIKEARAKEEELKASLDHRAKLASIVQEIFVKLKFPGVEILGEDGRMIENVRLVGKRGHLEALLEDTSQVTRSHRNPMTTDEMELEVYVLRKEIKELKDWKAKHTKRQQHTIGELSEKSLLLPRKDDDNLEKKEENYTEVVIDLVDVD